MDIVDIDRLADYFHTSLAHVLKERDERENQTADARYERLVTTLNRIAVALETIATNQARSPK